MGELPIQKTEKKCEKKKFFFRKNRFFSKVIWGHQSISRSRLEPCKGVFYLFYVTRSPSKLSPSTQGGHEWDLYPDHPNFLKSAKSRWNVIYQTCICV